MFTMAIVIQIFKTQVLCSEEYQGPCQTSMMELFVKMVDWFKYYRKGTLAWNGLLSQPAFSCSKLIFPALYC